MSEDQFRETGITGGLGISVEDVLRIPSIYFNGFEFGVTASDITVIVKTNGVPSARINFSYTTAKSLHKFLTKALNDLENATGQTLMDAEFIEERLSDYQKH